MELRQYWRIVYRRLWIVILLPVIVLGAGFLARPQTARAAVANLRLSVGIVPENGNGQFFTYDRYYSWLTAEYLADDLSEIVKSRLFADLVSQKMGGSIGAASIQGSTTPQKLHRILTVSVSAPTEQQAMAIAAAVAATLRDDGNQFLPQLSAQNAALSVIDPPALVPVGPSLKEKLDLPLRVLLAVATGLALAFLIDYLDDSVRDAGDVETLQLGVLAEIPK
jgi:capsular polysaccharide biosynthesis protein